eukprot:22185_4
MCSCATISFACLITWCGSSRPRSAFLFNVVLSRFWYLLRLFSSSWSRSIVLRNSLPSLSHLENNGQPLCSSPSLPSYLAS